MADTVLYKLTPDFFYRLSLQQAEYRLHLSSSALLYKRIEAALNPSTLQRNN
jgi:hypothetical protein